MEQHNSKKTRNTVTREVNLDPQESRHLRDQMAAMGLSQTHWAETAAKIDKGNIDKENPNHGSQAYRAAIGAMCGGNGRINPCLLPILAQAVDDAGKKSKIEAARQAAQGICAILHEVMLNLNLLAKGDAALLEDSVDDRPSGTQTNEFFWLVPLNERLQPSYGARRLVVKNGSFLGRPFDSRIASEAENARRYNSFIVRLPVPDSPECGIHHRHARVLLDAMTRQWQIQVFASAHHPVEINGIPVAAGEAVCLNQGDVIRFAERQDAAFKIELPSRYQ